MLSAKAEVTGYLCDAAEGKWTLINGVIIKSRIGWAYKINGWLIYGALRYVIMLELR